MQLHFYPHVNTLFQNAGIILSEHGVSKGKISYEACQGEANILVEIERHPLHHFLTQFVNQGTLRSLCRLISPHDFHILLHKVY